ncbi:glycosyl transferase family 1 [Paenibacillus pectinilyticus]|uniref:Glycosyl transferase family 1 n=1 Tax=Paenibacillus pectinilyticus TaxID=512399 RepID=A0A1C0ZSH5_9BACL|nr:glycosyltransferase family 1 protein [Paenibacillus pectinilyticus]OCT11039.1 glycosyl transferase family 1 [Paenibacillus pectinilyticus]
MGDPIRILHVVVNMNRGGAETLLMNLYRNVDRTKIQFDFLTCKAGAYDVEIRELGGVIHRIPYVTDIGHKRYIQALDQFFADEANYKIVHAHMDKMSGFILRSAKKARIPIRIAHSHNTSSEGGLTAKAYKWFAGTFIASCATHFLACSNKAAQWLFASKRSKVMLLKNGIESDQFAYSPMVRKQIRRELQLSPDAYVIGHVGRFTHQKNHTYLLELFARMQQEKPDAVLVLVGDGPLREEIEQKAEALQLQHKVKFLGVRSDIAQLLQGFDMFVFPSLHEGLPVTLIEAQGAGLPCVISDEITEEVDMGIHLVDRLPLNNQEVWIQRMKQVMASNGSRHIPALSLSNQGYDIRNTAAWTEGFYQSISR